MAAVEALERTGCDAAGYRLSGEGIDRLCVVHLWAQWRLLLAFPEAEIAIIIDLGQHLAHDPGQDIYQRLYEAVAMDPPDAALEQAAVL